MLIALLLDAAVGWPCSLFDRIGHPVTWIGAVVASLETRLNRAAYSAMARRLLGAVCALGVIGMIALVAWVVQCLLPDGLAGVLLAGAFTWPLVASRSLYAHVEAVATPLEAGDIDGARHAVSMIVGRDPSRLDAPGVARAAIESLAENTSDGIVAPLMWGLLLGLPGIAGYKAINTLDSMIAHRSPRYLMFGWAAARIDDVANFLPARLTALLVAMASPSPAAGVLIALKDARHHRSPNAGWPEAAMAGALGVRLSGPRIYDGQPSNEPWLNERGREAEAGDVRRALALYLRTMMALVILLVAIVAAAWELG